MTILNESIRKSEGNSKTVRLLYKQIDDRWLINKEKKGDYLVVCYNSEDDKYIPELDTSKRLIDKLYIWKEKYYNSIAGNPKIRDKHEQIKYAREEFKKKSIERYWFNNFKEAQDKFIELSKSECGNSEKPLIFGKTI